MRDDVKNLFNNLSILTDKKLETLQNLFRGEAQKKFLLDTGKTNDLLELIEKDSKIIEGLNSLEYDIKETAGGICKIVGIPEDEFPEFIEKRRENIIINLKNKMDDINTILKSLKKSREELAERMNLKLNDIDKDIKSISDIRKLKKVLHEIE